jgi:putative oxidoreductase
LQFDRTKRARRVLIALVFLVSGWGKIGGFSGVADHMAAKGVALPEAALALTILSNWAARS